MAAPKEYHVDPSTLTIDPDQLMVGTADCKYIIVIGYYADQPGKNVTTFTISGNIIAGVAPKSLQAKHIQASLKQNVKKKKCVLRLP
jgi:hypothetical protein